jgi:diguanylate cyclase (GGDEF)-like protein
MNEKAGSTPVGAAPAVGGWRPEVAPHAQLHAELAHGFWRDTPALSWLMQADTGELQFRATHAGDSPATNGATVHHEVLAGTLLRKVQRHGAHPLRMHEVLPGPDGQLHHFLIIGFPVGSGNGQGQLSVAGVAVDITDHQRRMNELVHQALEDELTGLYNLRGFFLFAEHELKVARRRGTRSAIVYVDVDGLKQVNDAQGHEGGNAALIATAALLRGAFRECDVIARLGGDEFAVFAADVQGAPELLRDRLHKAQALAAESDAGAVTVSAGVASSPADPGLRLADLLARADQAMYKEKTDKLARTPWAGKPG